MRIISSSFRCAKQRSNDMELATWAKSVIADPAAHRATPREATIVSLLLCEIGVAR